MIINKLDKFVFFLSTWMLGIGAILILALVTIGLIDIIGSKLFSKPVPGIIEAVSLVLGVTIAFAVSFTQLSRSNISVEIVSSRLPQRVKVIIDSFINFVLLALFSILTWQILKLGLSYQVRGELSQTIRLPLYIFNYIMVIALLAACLVFLLNLVKYLREIRRNEPY